jgi:short-subunit dehydrogenase
VQQNTDLTGKVAVITGATTGIGLALAACAAERGMRLALVDPDESRLAGAVKVLKTSRTPIVALRADTSDLTATHNLARCIERELGSPWLVCNHSETTVELNRCSIVHGVQVFAPILAKRGEGHIVNLISADHRSASCPSAYVAARHAMVGISTALYRELDCLGSRVGVSLVCRARTDWHLTILASAQLNDARHRAIEAPHPERLAEEIFAAIKTRRFWIFCDRAKTRTPDLLEAEGLPGGERQQPSAEKARSPFGGVGSAVEPRFNAARRPRQGIHWSARTDGHASKVLSQAHSKRTLRPSPIVRG